MVGVSSGTDSSYMLVLAKQYGLRPLAVHYDNTWNSAIATQNIFKVTKALDVDLYTHFCNNKELDDIFRSFFLASVPEIDGATDIALAEVIYWATNRYSLKYVFEGHSFVEEGVAPMGKAYVEGGLYSQLTQAVRKNGNEHIPEYDFLKIFVLDSFQADKKNKATLVFKL